MSNLLRRLTAPAESERSMDQLQDLFAPFGGFQYALTGRTPQGPPGVPSEPPPSDFTGMVRSVYERNGVVAGCMTARQSLLSGARFKWRMLSDRKVFGDEALRPLEAPTVNETSADYLIRMDQDATLAGNAYRVRIGSQIHRVRPDWMSIVIGSNMVDPKGKRYEAADAPDATVVGYAYWPKGVEGGYEPMLFLPSEVAHYAPEPDPLAKFRGTSWLCQVLAEIDTDRQMTQHKAKFLEKGVPPFAIKYPPELTRGDGGEKKAAEVVKMFQDRYREAANWEALHLFGGADPVTLGLNFRDIDFKAIQGAGETRIAMRARVPASVLGISEGLAGSALNAGNFGQSRRSFGEQFFYPSMAQICSASVGLLRVPAGAELWYDSTDVAFLHEDARDAAEVIATQAAAIRQLIETGMQPDAAVAAVTGGDLSLLSGKHTGLVSVQLQPPGTTPTTTNSNGSAQPALNGAN